MRDFRRSSWTGRNRPPRFAPCAGGDIRCLVRHGRSAPACRHTAPVAGPLRLSAQARARPMSALPGPLCRECPMAGTCRAPSSGSKPVAPASVCRSFPSVPAPVPQANAPRRTTRCPVKVSPSTPADPPLRRTRLQASARRSSRHTLSISAWKRRSGSFLAFACNTVWSFRTFSDPGRLSPVVTPCFLSVSLSNQGSFPPPALPGIRGTASPSATLPARSAPRGVPVGMCAPPTGLPVLLPPPSSMRAAATTPAEPAGAYVAHFPARGSLPRKTGGSDSALRVSRPARRSLALRPVWSLGRPRRPVSPKCFRLCRYLHRPLRLLPAGATVAGRDSHPLRDSAFPRHTIDIA